MPIDPNIAMGIRPIEQPNMLAQMGQMMQLRQAQQEYEGSNALREAYAKGGDLNDPEFRRRVMAANPKLGSQLINQQSEMRARDVGTMEKRKALFDSQIKSATTPEHIAQITQAMYSDPDVGPMLTRIRPLADSLASIPTDTKGLEDYRRRMTLGADNLFESANAQLSSRTSLATTGMTNAQSDINSRRLDERSRQQFQYNIDNPVMQPLAGEKVVNGEKVPAYFGYDPRSNSMVEVSMPTVTVGAPTTLSTNALAPTAAPANVNALTMPPAGAPTSPVARPVTAAMPSAVAPSAAMPSAASPTSVVPGGANAPAPVRFGPKSTAENLTEAQGKATGFALRAKQASDILDIVGKDGKVQPGMLKRVGEAVPLVGEGLGTMLNVTQTPQQQQVEQAQRSFVNAILRQESGAAINESEFNNAKKQYFPQPGDSKEVIDQKRLNRETAVSALSIAGGPGMKQANAANPATGIKIGTVEEGYRFKGGDPANKNNWEKQ
jgi:hypothetical protein